MNSPEEMSAAENMALELYPNEYYPSCPSYMQTENIVRNKQREAYVKGWKDSELDWFDIDLICSIMMKVDQEKYPPLSVAFYKEVSKRFNLKKKEYI